MRIVYIAGPFRAPTGWQIEANVRRAEALALEVWKLGAMAYCPHLNTRHFQGEAPDEVWLEGNLEMLARCDAVLLVSGWVGSVGTMLERNEAFRAGMRVFEGIENLDARLAIDRPGRHRQDPGAGG